MMLFVGAKAIILCHKKMMFFIVFNVFFGKKLVS
jgi:hypothetical protein